MVGNITSLTNNGLRDWLIQRVSAVVIGAYALFMIFFLIQHAPLDYTTWRDLFDHPAMQIATVVTLFAVLFHAWIGLWTVSTDYLKNLALRLTFQIVVLLTLFACLVWAIMILWGN